MTSAALVAILFPKIDFWQFLICHSTCIFHEHVHIPIDINIYMYICIYQYCILNGINTQKNASKKVLVALSPYTFHVKTK